MQLSIKTVSCCLPFLATMLTFALVFFSFSLFRFLQNRVCSGYVLSLLLHVLDNRELIFFLMLINCQQKNISELVDWSVVMDICLIKQLGNAKVSDLNAFRKKNLNYYFLLIETKRQCYQEYRVTFEHSFVSHQTTLKYGNVNIRLSFIFLSLYVQGVHLGTFSTTVLKNAVLLTMEKNVNMFVDVLIKIVILPLDVLNVWKLLQSISA